MLKARFFILSLFLFGFIFVKNTFAGGGDVYVTASPMPESWADRRFFTVRVYITPFVACSNIPVTFKLEDPQEGDMISTDSGNSTSIIKGPNPRSYNGRIIQDCTTYAKVHSASNTERRILVSVVMPSGKVEERINVLNFQWSDPNPYVNNDISTPWDDIIPTSVSAQITVVKTSPFTSGESKKIETKKLPPISPKSEVVNITKEMAKEAVKEQVTKNNIENQNTSSSNEAVNKRVAELEKKLAESQKKQSVLEQQVQSLFSYIKKLFPFFK